MRQLRDGMSAAEFLLSIAAPPQKQVDRLDRVPVLPEGEQNEVTNRGPLIESLAFKVSDKYSGTRTVGFCCRLGGVPSRRHAVVPSDIRLLRRRLQRHPKKRKSCCHARPLSTAKPHALKVQSTSEKPASTSH